ncbi:MAG: BrnT family toxin [Deltaproteobacteria bacterium]|nr:BrnT family toxin [Deltaproteobacteria bacterium]
MKIGGLIWLAEIVDKLDWKHNVQQQEVREVFRRKPKYRFVEKGHRRGENVYVAQGRTEAGRYLNVFFVYKTNQRALILSAREMTPAEKRTYGKK